MQGDRLKLMTRDDEPVAWLLIESASEHAEPVWLHNGFAVGDVREALLATGWVRGVGDDLLQTNDLRCATITDHLQEMLGYFSAPGIPSRMLLDLCSMVQESAAFQQLKLDIPLYAYAWLDVMVRDDIADEARSATAIWTTEKLQVECERFRRARVEELIARYSHAAVPGRMAGSLPTRLSGDSREFKTG